MPDWAAILEHAFKDGAKTSGDGGDTGDSDSKPRITHENSNTALVTIDCPPLVTLEPSAVVVTTVTTAEPNGGDGLDQKNRPLIQRPPAAVTSVTTVSTSSKQEENPIARLRAIAPPDDFSMWPQLLKDADRFCLFWLEEARSLGWSETELFGVHPRAPAARFDAMGLVLLIRGGDVVSLDCKQARLKTVGGSSVVVRKPRNPDAVPVWCLVP